MAASYVQRCDIVDGKEAVVEIDSDGWPPLFVGGRYLVSVLFGRAYPRDAEVYASKLIRPDEARRIFGIPRPVSVTVTDAPPPKALNVDLWALLPSSEIVLLDAAHPVSQTLYSIAELTVEDAIRYLVLATNYPWKNLDPTVMTVLDVAQRLRRDDPALSEALAMSYGGVTWAELAGSARKPIGTR